MCTKIRMHFGHGHCIDQCAVEMFTNNLCVDNVDDQRLDPVTGKERERQDLKPTRESQVGNTMGRKQVEEERCHHEAGLTMRMDHRM